MHRSKTVSNAGYFVNTRSVRGGGVGYRERPAVPVVTSFECCFVASLAVFVFVFISFFRGISHSILSIGPVKLGSASPL